MKALIIRYLWVTGIGAAVVLAMPSLVIIGLMALIVPGVILAVLPSAFAYGVVFALGWDGLFDRHARDRDWQLTLARLGRPVEAIAKPPNLSGTEVRFHENLRNRRARFDPARDCRG